MTRSDHFHTAWKNLCAFLASHDVKDDRAWNIMFVQAMTYSISEITSYTPRPKGTFLND